MYIQIDRGLMSVLIDLTMPYQLSNMDKARAALDSGEWEPERD